MTDEQRAALEKLLDHRDTIQESLTGIENILRASFPKEHISYQHQMDIHQTTQERS